MINGYKTLSVIAIGLLGVLIYAHTFHVPFIFDDISSVVNNAAIRDLFNIQHIWDFWPSRFITYLSIALNFHLNGLNVVGYHVLNLAVHVITAVLVWWLVLLTCSSPAMKEERISGHAPWIALFAGLIFVAHPIQTEAVTYITQRAALMAALFYLLTLCFYVKSRLLQIGGEGSWFLYYSGSMIWALAAFFIKETVITLPLMIVFYEYCFLRINRRFDWRMITPMLIYVGIILLIMATLLSAKEQNLRGMPGISPVHYCLTELRVIITYVRLLFFPLDQNFDHDYPVYKSILEMPVLASFLFISTILFLSKRLFLKYRLLSFSMIWFLLTLLPESSFFPIIDVISEHRLYLPMVGYALFLTSFIYYIFIDKDLLLVKISFIVMIGLYAAMAYERNSVWQTSVRLWSDVIDKSPGKARAYFNRADAFQDQGDMQDAVIDYKNAVSLNPNFALFYNTLGLYYEHQGDLKQAIVEYTKSINMDPGHALVYFRRGIVYAKAGDPGRAKLDHDKAVLMDPGLKNAI